MILTTVLVITCPNSRLDIPEAPSEATATKLFLNVQNVGRIIVWNITTHDMSVTWDTEKQNTWQEAEATILMKDWKCLFVS